MSHLMTFDDAPNCLWITLARCQLGQTMGEIYLTVTIEDSAETNINLKQGAFLILSTNGKDPLLYHHCESGRLPCHINLDRSSPV